MTDKSVEQQARDLLERMGIEGAQSFSSGDLVELANLIAEVRDWKIATKRMLEHDIKLFGEFSNVFKKMSRAKAESLEIVNRSLDTTSQND